MDAQHPGQRLLGHRQFVIPHAVAGHQQPPSEAASIIVTTFTVHLRVLPAARGVPLSDQRGHIGCGVVLPRGKR